MRWFTWLFFTAELSDAKADAPIWAYIFSLPIGREGGLRLVAALLWLSPCLVVASDIDI